MADTKISALPASTTPLAGTEVLPIVQGGATKQVSVANLTAGRAVATAGGSFTDNITQSTAGKGVNFAANTPAAGMTSQLLNAYEEGAFTATVKGDSTAGTGTYSAQAGYYTRIGNVVNFRAAIVWSAHTGTGNLVIDGLPFTLNNSVQSTSIFTVMQQGITLTALNIFTSAYGVANTKTAACYSMPVGGGGLNNIALPASGTIYISGVYAA
jgi:hypothetical protein